MKFWKFRLNFLSLSFFLLHDWNFLTCGYLVTWRSRYILLVATGALEVAFMIYFAIYHAAMTANPSKPGLHGALSRFRSAPTIGAGPTVGLVRRGPSIRFGAWWNVFISSSSAIAAMTANPSKPGLHGALSRFRSAPTIGAGPTVGLVRRGPSIRFGAWWNVFISSSSAIAAMTANPCKPGLHGALSRFRSAPTIGAGPTVGLVRRGPSMRFGAWWNVFISSSSAIAAMMANPSKPGLHGALSRFRSAPTIGAGPTVGLVRRGPSMRFGVWWNVFISSLSAIAAMTANPSKPGLHGTLSRFRSAPTIGAGPTVGLVRRGPSMRFGVWWNVFFLHYLPLQQWRQIRASPDSTARSAASALRPR